VPDGGGAAVKAAPLTLVLLSWAAQARADVAVPEPAANRSWRDGCVARLDAAAKRLGLAPRARITMIPLVRDDGSPSPVQYVEFGREDFTATAGEDDEARPDAPWTRTRYRGRHGTNLGGDSLSSSATWFRRMNNRFGKIEGLFSTAAEREFKLALDDCLKMGESK